MGLKEILLNLVNHVPWREEREYLEAREDVENEFPVPSVESGVKDADGNPFRFTEQ